MEASSGKTYIQLLLLALLGIGLSIYAQYYVNGLMVKNQTLALQRTASHLQAKIQDEISLDIGTVNTVRALLETQQTAMSPAEWDQQVEKYINGFSAIEAVMVVSLAGYTDDAVVDVIMNYPAGNTVFSAPLTQDVIDQMAASQAGKPAVIDLQNHPKTQRLTLSLPIDSPSVAGLASTRYLLLSYRFDTLLQKVMQGMEPGWFDISIYYSYGQKNTLLSSYHPDSVPPEHETAADERDIYAEDAVSFFGYPLSLIFHPQPEGFQTLGIACIVPLFSGLTITLLLVAWQSSLIRQKQRIEQQFALQTRELEHSYKEKEGIINSIDGVLWKFNLRKQCFTFISEQLGSLLKIKVDNVQEAAAAFFNRVHPDDQKLLEETRTYMQTHAGTTRNIEYRMIRMDGETIWVRNIITTISEAGEPAFNIGVLLDITTHKKLADERHLMEMQLRQAQKMEAIGQLAAGIAHEINTPTQFVNDNTHFLQEAFKDIIKLLKLEQQLVDTVTATGEQAALKEDVLACRKRIDVEFLLEEIPDCISQSLEGLKRLSSIVKAMKEFSHPGTSKKELTNINSAIQSTITVARNEWKYVADVVTDFDTDLPMVKVFPGEFNQVILNMTVNAAQAIADKTQETGRKGQITITTSYDDEAIQISIADTGSGIAKENLNKIFDPFFTTKEVGKGTGQGLAIAFSVVVDKHQGELQVESEPGKGTRFIIRIPIEQQELAEAC